MIKAGNQIYRKEPCNVSLHSYSRCWLHLIWTTLDREPMLTKAAAVKGSGFLNSYAKEKGIYMKINYFNAEHVHTLIDLSTNMAIEDVVKLLKGSSSHWINEHKLLRGRFSWGRGYGAFSVSPSQVNRVASYIAGQKEHHHKKTFNEKFEIFVKRYGLVWRDEGNR
jgi:REP element-mobilizing transposase RayT